MTTYYASGLLLGAETVVGTASDMVDALIQVQLSGIGTSDRATARRAIAIAVAQEVQEALLETAVKAGWWSTAGASDVEHTRLSRSRAITDRDGVWTSRAVALVIVTPEDPSWEKPRGKCLAIDPRSDLALVKALILTSWLKVERLE